MIPILTKRNHSLLTTQNRKCAQLNTAKVSIYPKLFLLSNRLDLSILGIGYPEDLPAEPSNEGGRLIHRWILGNWDVCWLVHTLPVLDLREWVTYESQWQPVQHVYYNHSSNVLQSTRTVRWKSTLKQVLDRPTFVLRKLLHSCSTL